MKFFISAESYKTVFEKIRIANLEIQSKISDSISQKKFGDGISFWGYISICCPQELYDGGFFKEIKKYSKKDREVDLRLKVDYEHMLHADKEEVSRLICISILKGIDIIEKELNVANFNFSEFKKEMVLLFQKEKWI